MRRFRAAMIVFAVVSLMAPVAAFAQEQIDDSAQTEVTDQVVDEEQPSEGDAGSDLDDASSSGDAAGANGEPPANSQGDTANGDEPADETTDGEDSADDDAEDAAPANDSAAGDPTETSEQNAADEEPPVVASAAIEPGDVTVTITKVVVDGDGTETFTINQTAPTFDSYFVGDTDTFPVSAPPGTLVSLNEPIEGLWRPTSFVCTGAESIGPSSNMTNEINMAVQLGDSDAECTLTNERLPSVSLTVNKVVSGLDTGDQFQIGLSNDELSFYPNLLFAFGGSSETIEVPANTSLFVTEYFPLDWSLNELSCTNAATTLLESGESAANGSITTTDVDATCTFANSPPPPVELTVTKVVVDGDGTESFDFVFGDETVSLGNGDSHTVSVPHGQYYGFFEQSVDGWYVSDFDCGDERAEFRAVPAGTSLEVFSATAAVSCTVTNSPGADVVFSLTKVAADDPTVAFSFNDYFEGVGFELSDGDEYALTVSPGSQIVIDEFLPDDWEAVSLDCTGTEAVLFFPDIGGSAVIDVIVGTADVACTLTNRIPPRVDLTISKVADGAAAGESFDFSINHGEPTYEVDDIEVEAGSSVAVSVLAGSLVEIGEPAPVGWVFESVECANATIVNQNEDGSRYGYAQIQLGDANASCTFTNRAVPTVEVTLTKELDGVVSDQVFDFKISGGQQIGLASGQSTTFEINALSRVSLSERYPYGWQASGFVCTGAENYEVFLGDSTSTDFAIEAGTAPIECTVTNSTVPAVQLTIVKEVIGEIDAGFEFFWSTSALDVFLDDTFMLADGETETIAVPPSSIVRIEEYENGGFDGWRFDNFECEGATSEINSAGNGFASVQVFLGDEDVTCTFTNEALARPTLVVTKAIAGEDPSGGADTFEVNTPGGSITLAAGETSAPIELPGPGFFFISEWLGGNNADWIAVDVVCMVGDEDVTQFVGLSQFSDFVEAEFLVDWNSQVECTVTNQPNSATLSITKQLDGGTSDQVFRFNLSNGENVFTLGDGDTANFAVRPGSFSLTESTSVGWELTDLTCTNAESASITGPAEMQIDIAVDAQVECVVTNTAVEPATITLAKVVTGDGPTTDFTFAAGPSIFETVPGGESRTFAVNPGRLIVQEFLPTGWKLADWTCVGGTLIGTDLDNGFIEVDLEPGADFACTVTNNWDPDATLTINKVIEGEDPADGGRPFSFFIGGNLAELTPGVPEVVAVGAGFVDVSEIVPSGWQAPLVECVQADRINFLDPDSGYVALNVQPGDDIECTFTNRRVPATEVTIIKSAPGSTESFEFQGPNGTFRLSDGESTTFLVDDSYFNVVELVRPGWEAEVRCTGDVGWSPTLSAIDPNNEVVFEGAFVGPATGAPITCEFVNTPAPTGQLTLTKAVTGESTTDTFNFNTPIGPVNLGAGESVTFAVRPDVPSIISEFAGAPNWQLAGVECVGDGIFDERPPDGTDTLWIAVAAGGDVECTFTNERTDALEPGRLTIVKKVVGVDAAANPDLAATEFDFRLNGGATFALADGGSEVIDVTSGFGLSRFVEELMPTGWQVREISCDAGDFSQTSPHGFWIVIDPGEDVTCTFVNEPVGTASIVVTKVADGAGTGDVFSFITPQGIVEVAAGSSATIEVNAGNGSIFEDYDVAWVNDSIDCSGADVRSLDFASGVEYTLDPGDELNCTFTNVPRPHATVNITKEISDGSSTDRMFTFETVFDTVTIGADETASLPLPLGQTSIFEFLQAGFELDSVTCDGGEPQRRPESVDLFVVEGQEVNCTFVNRPVAPIDVSLTKTVSGFDDGTAFEFFATGVAPQALRGGDTVSFEVAAGYFAVLEGTNFDWEVVQVSCDRKRALHVERIDFIALVEATVLPGDELSCEFVNELREQPETGSLEIRKVVEGVDGGEQHQFVDPFGDGFALRAGEGHVVTVAAGVSNIITETVQPEWTLGEIVCTGAEAFERAGSSLEVTVGSGGTAICTFVNESPPLPPDPDPVVTVGGEPADPDAPVGLVRDDFDISYDAGPECAGLTGTWTLRDALGREVDSGELSDDGSGVYSATVTPPEFFVPTFDLSSLTVELDVPCEGLDSTFEQSIEFIDPAGTIVDCVGDSVVGATVTLMREVDGSPGVFEAVLNGDGTVIDLTVNGMNPITTDATGTFQWFTIAGNYRVDATFTDASGTTSSASSDVLPVPPEQIDVVVTFDDLNCETAPTDDNSSGGTSSPTSGSSSDGFVVQLAAPVAPAAVSPPAAGAPDTPALAVTGTESKVLSFLGIWLFGAGSLFAGLSRSRKRSRR